MGVFDSGNNDESGKACSKVLEIHRHKRKVWRDIKSIEATDAHYSYHLDPLSSNQAFYKDITSVLQSWGPQSLCILFIAYHGAYSLLDSKFWLDFVKYPPCPPVSVSQDNKSYCDRRDR